MKSWLKAAQFKLEDLPDLPEDRRPAANDPARLLDTQQAFGYTQEDLAILPGADGQERRRSDRIDGRGHADRGALPNKAKLLYNYFKQNFAQVTNPPIDPIREELVMSLVSMIGPRPNLLGREAGAHKRLEVSQPVLTNADVEKIRSISELVDGAFRTATIDCTWPAGRRRRGPVQCGAAHLSQRHRCGAGGQQHPDPVGPRRQRRSHSPFRPLLAIAAIHHHLVRQGLRMQTGLVVETGEAREVHHFCVLAGYGAEAINPYLAFETLEQIRVRPRAASSRPMKSRRTISRRSARAS